MAMAWDHSMGSSPMARRKVNSPFRAGSLRPWMTKTFLGSTSVLAVVTCLPSHSIHWSRE